MPVITAGGEPVKVAGPGDAGKEYDFRLQGNSVLLARSKQAAGDTYNPRRRLRKGDRGTLRREQGEELWAFNDDLAGDGSDAKLEMQQTGFFVEFGSRPVVGAVDTNRSDAEAPAASDDWDEATGSAVDIGSGGSTTETLVPPGRADQVMLRVEGTASFDVQVTWNNTSETFSSASGVVAEVLPVNYISDNIDVTITDTSAGANAVDYDMVVV